MARPRFENLEKERQERILAAAAAEFASRGYGGASVNRILEGSGLSKGVLYYYFEDKEDLFVTTLERAMGRLFAESGMNEHGLEEVERWVEAVPADGFWEALQAMSREEVVVARSGEWWAELARSWSRLREEPAARVAMERVVDLGRRMARALIVRGRELGLIRTDVPEDLLVECFMALDEVTDRWIVDRSGEAEESALEALSDMRVELIRDLLDARHEGWEQ
jgi:AcrR family transcriptional regulator